MGRALAGSSLRILYVSGFANRAGGADVYTEELAVGLAERGHQVHLACSAASPRAQQACTYWELPSSTYDSQAVLWRIGRLLAPRHWTRVFKSLDASRFDVAICSPASCVAPLVRAIHPVPVIYLPHTWIYPEEIRRTFAHAETLFRIMQVLAGTLQERSALRTATVTVRFSSSAERALRAYYRLRDETSFEIIRSSIPAASAHVDVRRRPFSERAVKLLIVGRLVSSKNIDTALRILASMPVNSWELGIVGDGEERSRLEDLCRTLGIASRVVFHGHRDRVDEHYASADLLLLPSRLENYPLVLIEAMSQGLPAIAFRPTAEHLNCNDEIIRPGINGFLCSSDGEFEECVRGILTAPDRLHPLFESTFAEFVAHFSWKTFLDRWDELLDRLALPSRTTS